MRLNPLTLDHKSFFDRFISDSALSLSSYAFVALFIWKDFFDLYYCVSRSTEQRNHSDRRDCLCIFAKQGNDYYMPILPIPCRINSHDYQQVTYNAYQHIVKANKNPEIARIENVPEDYLSVFREAGFDFIPKETEYVYRTHDLCELKGNNYKQQRNTYNRFLAENNTIEYIPYQSRYQEECFALYKQWKKSRIEKYDDPIFQGMLEDSESAHQIGITHHKELGLIGRVVKIDEKLCAYTFGYELNSETFCILFEIADLNVKGLSQYINREFSKELSSSYEWVNAMSDSGLENLKRVKLSYHPKQIIPSYNVYDHNTNIP